ncbi:unnamed protein product [Amoebophrya sp. A25]|nr:unnamed protein product [Amoebophrya sp. A25]|eukprot:GSA25T00004157001.1
MRCDADGNTSRTTSVGPTVSEACLQVWVRRVRFCTKWWAAVPRTKIPQEQALILREYGNWMQTVFQNAKAKQIGSLAFWGKLEAHDFQYLDVPQAGKGQTKAWERRQQAAEKARDSNARGPAATRRQGERKPETRNTPAAVGSASSSSRVQNVKEAGTSGASASAPALKTGAALGQTQTLGTGFSQPLARGKSMTAQQSNRPAVPGAESSRRGGPVGADAKPSDSPLLHQLKGRPITEEEDTESLEEWAERFQSTRQRDAPAVPGSFFSGLGPALFGGSSSFRMLEMDSERARRAQRAQQAPGEGLAGEELLGVTGSLVKEQQEQQLQRQHPLAPSRVLPNEIGVGSSSFVEQQQEQAEENERQLIDELHQDADEEQSMAAAVLADNGVTLDNFEESDMNDKEDPEAHSDDRRKMNKRSRGALAVCQKQDQDASESKSPKAKRKRSASGV